MIIVEPGIDDGDANARPGVQCRLGADTRHAAGSFLVANNGIVATIILAGRPGTAGPRLCHDVDPAVGNDARNARIVGESPQRPVVGHEGRGRVVARQVVTESRSCTAQRRRTIAGGGPELKGQNSRARSRRLIGKLVGIDASWKAGRQRISGPQLSRGGAHPQYRQRGSGEDRPVRKNHRKLL